MNLDQRDLTIIQYVSRFGQLTPKHIQQLVFAGISHSPLDRALLRLTDRGYLARIERRMVGGVRGGSGQYVYQLGLHGHRVFTDTRYSPGRAINYHSLAIADCFVMLHGLEQAGKFRIHAYSTEPDSHVTIGGYVLKPDLYVELVRPDNSIRIMVEVDMGSQGQRQITEKFARYWEASQVLQPAWPEDQYVFFVAVDDRRAQELRWLLDKGKPEQKAIFRIRTLETLREQLSG